MMQEPEMSNQFGFTQNSVKQPNHNKIGDAQNTSSEDQSKQQERTRLESHKEAENSIPETGGEKAVEVRTLSGVSRQPNSCANESKNKTDNLAQTTWKENWRGLS